MKEKERIWGCFETIDLILWRNTSQLSDSCRDCRFFVGWAVIGAEASGINMLKG